MDSLNYSQSCEVVNQLINFCLEKYVGAHICFTGGNPFLYKHFFKVYQYAVSKGVSISILGNPVKEDQIKKMLEIKNPRYYQVSLEGLQEKNDSIRGSGNFSSVLSFLDILKKYKIRASVMLTLCQENVEEVFELAQLLENKADYFTFNRLSLVGEALSMKMVKTTKYKEFLKKYIKAAKKSSIMGFKDNLINICLKENDDFLFSGCTGHGCGAAYNFVALLPNGEVHACRKFPSKIGNIFKNNLLNLYDSISAIQYRTGSEECMKCNIKNVCGGCLASTYSYGKNIFKDKDPYCFS